MGWSPEYCRLIKDNLIETCEQIRDAGTGSPESPHLSALARIAADLIRSLGDGHSREIIEPLADAFGLSLVDAASLITDTPQNGEIITAREGGIPELETVVGQGNVLADYLELTHDTESPPIYHLAALLTAVSASVQRRTALEWGGLFTVHPNVYTILCGPTGARKNTAINLACKTVRTAYDKLHIIPAEGSPQGLIDALQEQADIDGTGHGLIKAVELKVLFGQDTYKAAYAEWLTDLYDCDDEWARRLRKQKISVKRPYVSLLGGTTLAWMREMPSSVIHGGFMTRVWSVWAPSKQHYKYRVRLDKALQRKIVRELSARLRGIEGPLELSSKADTFLEQWYEVTLPQEAQKADPEIRAYYERLLPHLLKLSQLIHITVGAGGTKIHLETVKRAMALMRLTEPGTRVVMRDITTNPRGGAVTRDILAEIRDAGGRAHKVNLIRRLQLTYPKRMVEEALKTLEYTETVGRDVVRGREAYFLREVDL